MTYHTVLHITSLITYQLSHAITPNSMLLITYLTRPYNTSTQNIFHIAHIFPQGDRVIVHWPHISTTRHISMSIYSPNLSNVSIYQAMLCDASDRFHSVLWPPKHASARLAGGHRPVSTTAVITAPCV